MGKVERIAEEWIQLILEHRFKRNDNSFLNIDAFYELKDKRSNYIKERANLAEKAPNKFSKFILKNIDALIAFHGTTSRLRKLIEENGLVPRTETGMEATDAVGSHQGRIYFGGSHKCPGNSYAVTKAEELAREIGGAPMLVKSVLPAKNLYPDEDFDGGKNTHERCFVSIINHGTIAYKGRVPPENTSCNIIGDAVNRKDSSQLTKEQAERVFNKLG